MVSRANGRQPWTVVMNKTQKNYAPSESGAEYRAMQASDIDAAWSLSTDQHWSHRPVDWQDALALGDGIVVVADDQLVGTAMRWRWGDGHATVGLVIVAEEMRGRRIGSALMNRLLDGLEDCSVSLHATEEGRGLYERLGFVRTGEIRQHQGTPAGAPLIALDEGWRLRPLDRSDESTLFELDARARGWPRPQLLRLWLDSAERVVALDHDGTLDGYAILRRFGRGVVIGPVVASDDLGARALIAHLVNLAAGRFVRIDLDFDSGLTTWLEELQLHRAGTVTAMTRGRLQRNARDVRLFALATQALG
jgi:predicted GNAT family N-acyltransferase